MNASAVLKKVIAERGAVGYDVVTSVALYDPDAGFYATGGAAGRRAGDFITSPEVGPLFGAVVAEALDRHWSAMGEPPVFRVAESAAGRGTLARAIRRASPRCTPALDYTLVDTSKPLRSQHDLAPPFRSAAAIAPDADIVIANELLDNLGFRIARLVHSEWHEVMVTCSGDSFVETTTPLDIETLPAEVNEALNVIATPAGGAPIEVPLAVEAWAWVRDVRRTGAAVVVFDYGAATADLARRPDRGWLRTYRNQQRGGSPLTDLGDQDITIDVPFDQLPGSPRMVPQHVWLRDHGIDDLVADGDRIWRERAAIGDLAAIAARSRSTEAAALLDPGGLGGFVVAEWPQPR